MGGNINKKKGNIKLTEAQLAAKEAERKQKEKQSLIIRVCIAAAVVIVAVVACVFMLTHDFNSDRDILHGTYYAERRFLYETESGSDITNIHNTYVAVFCEDGRSLSIYDTKTYTSYYEYDGSAEEPYDGIIKQYVDGEYAQDINITREDNGDMVMYYITDSISFTVPKLIECFGEADTLSMLRNAYDEELCRLLMAGDHDSITGEQLAALGIEREQLSELAFSIKDLSTVVTMYKISDEELSRAKALEIWNAQYDVPSDTASQTDVSASDNV